MKITNKTCPYRPLGTRVVLKILPVENDQITRDDGTKVSILTPDGVTKAKTRQTFQVIAMGAEVNDDKYSLSVDEVVLVSCHNSEILPLDQEEQLIMVDRSKIVAVLESQTQN